MPNDIWAVAVVQALCRYQARTDWRRSADYHDFRQALDYDMQFLVISIIVVVTTIGFLTEGNIAMKSSGWLPKYLGFLPEVLGLAVTLFVIILGVRSRFKFVRPGYWFTFGGIVVCIFCGILVNAVEPGPIFAGIRYYLKAIPMFFLPAVFLFTDRQLLAQLNILVGIAILQLPLAVYQRLETRAMGAGTGDWTSGTLLISSIMSTYLICCVCVLAAFYLRKRLSLGAFLLIALLFLAPTTINETKGTLLLLPIGLIVVFLLGSQAGNRIKYVAVATGILVVFGALFVSVYDEFIVDKRPDGSISEFLNPEHTEDYLLRGADVGAASKARRGDAVIVPLKSLSNDPVRLVFGLGIGNVSDSALGDNFTGRYHAIYAPFLLHVFAQIVLELGVMGTALVFVLFWLVFRDSCVVANGSGGAKGMLALGWAGVTAVLAVGMFYKQFIRFDSISFLFWFYAGMVAAERVRLAQDRAEASLQQSQNLKQDEHEIAARQTRTL